MNIGRVLSFISLGLALSLLFFNSSSHAQDNVLNFEGIGDDLDKDRRSPNLSVSNKVNTSGSVTILADAFIPNKEFEKYPVKFDFYINQKLYSSQIRSKALPGGIGVEIAPEVAPIPFNYAVVATLLHPNRQFTTIIEGAVFSKSLKNDLSCTVSIEQPSTVEGEEADTTNTTATYISSEVKSEQSGNENFSLSFTGKDASEEDSAVVTVTINSTGQSTDGETTYTASVSVTEEDDTVTTFSGEADVTITDNVITSVAVSEEDSESSLSCS